MNRLRAAVIGCGAIAHHCHIPGYQKNKHCELIAVADPSSKNRKLACEKFGIARGYPDPLKMLEKEKPALVGSSSPNRFQTSGVLGG